MDSTYLEAILLGILQGVAEFLPISSSGHLVIGGAVLREFTGRVVKPDENLQMNIALHAGTLLSILVYYRRDVLRLFTRPRMCGLLVLSTLPLVVLGLTVKNEIEGVFETPLYAGVGLLVTAALLLWTTTFDKERDGLENVTAWQAFAVGLFQMVAIMPGVSRSGSTIAGGLGVGLDRNAATTYSFLIAIPAISGAVVLCVKDVVTSSAATAPPVAPLLVGAVVSFVVGWASLGMLVRVVARGQLHWFAAYCATVGTATILWQIVAASQPG